MSLPVNVTCGTPLHSALSENYCRPDQMDSTRSLVEMSLVSGLMVRIHNVAKICGRL